MNGLTSIRYEGVCDGNDGACVCVLAKMLMKNWSANVREKKRWIYYFMPIIKLNGGNEFGYGFDLWLIGIMYLVEFVCGTNEKENSWKNGVIILIDFRTIARKTRTSFVSKCTKMDLLSMNHANGTNYTRTSRQYQQQTNWKIVITYRPTNLVCGTVCNLFTTHFFLFYIICLGISLIF